MLEGKPLNETPAWRALQAHHGKSKTSDGPLDACRVG